MQGGGGSRHEDSARDKKNDLVITRKTKTRTRDGLLKRLGADVRRRSITILPLPTLRPPTRRRKSSAPAATTTATSPNHTSGAHETLHSYVQHHSLAAEGSIKASTHFSFHALKHLRGDARESASSTRRRRRKAPTIQRQGEKSRQQVSRTGTSLPTQSRSSLMPCQPTSRHYHCCHSGACHLSS